MDFETKTATFEILKDMERIFGLVQQLLQRDGRFLDKYTDEIDELITDFMDFWAIASYWVKEKLGLTVEEEDENEEEMEVDQASIEDRGEEQTKINKEMDHCEVRDAGDLLDEEEVKEFVEEDVAEGELGNGGCVRDED